MANATTGYFAGAHIFCVTNHLKPDTLLVKNFSDGFATVSPIPRTYIDDFVDLIIGCFDEQSNFPSAIKKVYQCEECEFLGIKFIFNEVTITVTKETADKEKILAEYDLKCDSL